MPMLVLMIACSGLAPRLAARIGVRLAMATGIFLGGAGLALMAILVSVDGGYLSVLPGYVVMGLGMGLAMTPSTEAITSSLPRERQGVASALNDIAREFGSGLGIALLGAVLAAGYSNAINSHLEGVPVERRRHRTQRHSQRSRNRQRSPPLLESTVPVRTGVIRPRLAASHVGGGHRDDDRACLRSRSGPERTSSRSPE